MDIKLDAPLLGALRCFEAAGRLGSFTKAAGALHLTQSAISQQIRQLEARLGYPLFVRHARGLELTPKGSVLYEATATAFGSLGRTLRQLSAPDAPLQVSCLPSFALQWLMPRLSEFHRLHPQTPVRLRAEFHAIDRETMRADDIDVAIRWDPFDYRALHVEPLFDEYLVAAAAPAYLGRHPPRATAKWISSVVPLHDASAWPDAPRYVEWRTWLDAVVPGYAGELRGPEFNLASLAIGAAVAGQGVVVCREALVNDEIARGRLVNVLGCRVPAPAQYKAICAQPEDARVKMFVDWLRAESDDYAARRHTAAARAPAA
ncbi:LysR substrate-binding domain-containing protein [Burkholderia thailandensis]|uniref:LysR substrate binding domain protein n=1 Tax=Burkholderia thailandensis TaxID=57975 RepID=A0AAW9CR53_BURTH|nr:LysR substrate-binding domain-containing protein [Burkholderia thailandensis]AHI67416.1 bacterial regulatory helix-turn-helix, lysR family protein [Burkholderia thailandensis H0587]AIP65740.1 LysR family transcriptional regulator [Burkholderia thailandensis]AOI53920.1 LysR family transcriptional regulator [Burkholderia thailandensis]AOJ52902.1 LysR family transcriptional regulator [Burkholderia thailandensis]AVR28981.1 LysR family transcriptional regulator [Burkholderia thailandensis]